MRLIFYGHACVGLVSEQGSSLLLDPYEPGGFGGKMAYAPIQARYDWVVCSHQHLDHCAVEGLPGDPVVVDQGCFGPFEVRLHRVAHDEYEGRRRGGFVNMLEIIVDGLTLLHGADVGQSPTPALIEALRRPDVWLVPVGGFFTIGAAQAAEWTRRLDPKLVIAIHDKRAQCALPIRGVEAFARYVEVIEIDSSELELHAPMGSHLAPLGGDVRWCGMSLDAVGAQEKR